MDGTGRKILTVFSSASILLTPCQPHEDQYWTQDYQPKNDEANTRHNNPVSNLIYLIRVHLIPHSYLRFL